MARSRFFRGIRFVNTRIKSSGIRATVFIQPSSTLPLFIVERVIGPLGMSARILLVDDNHIQSATRRAILEACGREVCIAPQGQQALELLNDAEASNPIGLIITDHLMPVMSGPEFVAELRRRDFTLPVVVLSGFPDAESAYEGLDVIFRLKPFDPEQPYPAGSGSARRVHAPLCLTCAGGNVRAISPFPQRLKPHSLQQFTYDLKVVPFKSSGLFCNL